MTLFSDLRRSFRGLDGLFLGIGLASPLLLFVLGWAVSSLSPFRLAALPLFWLLFLAGALRLGRAALQKSLPRALAEVGAFFCLITVLAWAVGPWLSTRLFGGGDALWYVQVVADISLQVREGVWPVWVGNTEFLFNGAVTPHQTAPGFSLWVALVDALTGQQMAPTSLLNAVMVSSVFASASIVWLFSGRVGLVHLGCRVGVCLITCLSPAFLYPALGLDLVLTGLAAPLLLVFFAGAVLLQLDRDRYAGWLVLLFGWLGLIWIHPPTAIWATVILFPVLAIEGVRVWRKPLSLGRLLFLVVAVGAGLLLPFTLAREMGLGNGEPFRVDRTLLLDQLRAYWAGAPWSFPVPSSSLSGVQVGLSAFLLGGLGLIMLKFLSPGYRLAWLGVLCLLFLFLAPWWADRVWLSLPEKLVAMANVWPTHRLIPIATAALLALGTVGAITAASRIGAFSRWARPALAFLLTWSLYQASMLRTEAFQRVNTTEVTERQLRANNRSLMIHSYGPTSFLPPTFHHGVMDPLLECRWIPVGSTHALIDEDGELQPSSGPSLRPFSELWLQPVSDGTWRGELALDSGFRYLAKLGPQERLPPGHLIVQGDSLFRVDRFPNPQSHSQKENQGSRNSTMSWWIEGDRTEKVVITFRPDLDSPQELKPYVRWTAIHESSLPLQWRGPLHNLVLVNARGPGQVLTPKLFSPYYRVGDEHSQEIPTKSIDGLLSFAPREDQRELSIEFRPPMSWTLSFWAGLLFSSLLVAGVFSRRTP